MTQDARAGMTATYERFATAWRRGDAAGVAACYTTDPTVLPPNAPLVKGAAANAERIRAYIQTAAAVTPEFTRVEVESFGDTAVEVGTFVVRNDAGAVVDRGKHIVVWKEQDGAWRLHWDCFNSDRPPPRQKSE